MTALLRLLEDEGGQDMVEYALLSAAIGLAAVGVFPLLLQAMGITYQSWITGTNNLWETPAPAGS